MFASFLAIRWFSERAIPEIGSARQSAKDVGGGISFPSVSIDHGFGFGTIAVYQAA
jgi:hypothetical protein